MVQLLVDVSSLWKYSWFLVSIIDQNLDIVSFPVVTLSFSSGVSGYGESGWGLSPPYHDSHRDQRPPLSCGVNTP